MAFHSLKDIINKAEKQNILFWEVILQDDMRERQVTKEESMDKMKQMYSAMRSADENYDKGAKSSSKLVGGDGERMHQERLKGNLICGDFIGMVIEKALKMGESNACMKRIVAAPTAGSCGVLPAILLAYQSEKKTSEEKIIEALYVAAGIGEVIANRAFISGAEGGCQAEIGSASAMVAGAIAYLQGGDNQAIVHAAAMSLKNLIGLACDPVAGLVEIPCIKRNVVGAVNALASADMAVAGIISVIPPDEVIDAMRNVGLDMNESIKETAKGGLAATPTAKRLTKELLNN